MNTIEEILAKIHEGPAGKTPVWAAALLRPLVSSRNRQRIDDAFPAEDDNENV